MQTLAHNFLISGRCKVAYVKPICDRFLAAYVSNRLCRCEHILVAYAAVFSEICGYFTYASIFRICFSSLHMRFLHISFLCVSSSLIFFHKSVSVKNVIAEAMYARPIGHLYTHTQDLNLVTANDSLLIICLNIRPNGARPFISIFSYLL